VLTDANSVGEAICEMDARQTLHDTRRTFKAAETPTTPVQGKVIAMRGDFASVDLGDAGILTVPKAELTDPAPKYNATVGFEPATVGRERRYSRAHARDRRPRQPLRLRTPITLEAGVRVASASSSLTDTMNRPYSVRDLRSVFHTESLVRDFFGDYDSATRRWRFTSAQSAQEAAAFLATTGPLVTLHDPDAVRHADGIRTRGGFSVVARNEDGANKRGTGFYLFRSEDARFEAERYLYSHTRASDTLRPRRPCEPRRYRRRPPPRTGERDPC